MTYDTKKFDGFDRPDETPKTFAELKPPGYWSKTLGSFVEVRKREWDPPSGKITSVKAPTQCALWKKPELIDEPRQNRFELLETFVDESHLSRELLRCKECGQLYFFEFYEEIDWEDGNDPQFLHTSPWRQARRSRYSRKHRQLSSWNISRSCVAIFPRMQNPQRRTGINKSQ
jgi:hypothetical protein